MGKKAWDIAREKRQRDASGTCDTTDAGTLGDAAAGPACAPLSPSAVLYEDAWILAVNKPAGIIVHGDGTGAATLTSQVRALLAQRHGASAPCVRELQALQRLDRDTCGIVLFSTCKETQAGFDALIAQHRLRKEYLAVVEGRVPWTERTLTQPLGRDRHDARKMRVSPSGKPAATHVRILAEKQVDGRTCTLLSVVIETGRKHQIRVHLSHAGFPLVGDVLYNPTVRRNEPLMLQAHRLTFTHPVTGERVATTAPAPAWAIA